MSTPSPSDLSPKLESPTKSALRQNSGRLGASSTDAPTSPTLQQLRDKKAEAEERKKEAEEHMTSLNKDIDRAMQGMFPKTATLSAATAVDYMDEDVPVDSAGSEDVVEKKLSVNSNQSVKSVSKVVSFTPSIDDAYNDDDDEDGVTQPLLRRDRSGDRRPSTHAHFEASNTSEIFDPKNPQYLATLSAERKHGELVRKLSRQRSDISDSGSDFSGVAMGKRCTIHRQGSIARQLSWSLRIFGLGLAFMTMVLLWEFTDYVMAFFFPNKEQVLIGYLVLAVMAAGSLALSQEWINKVAEDAEASSLPASFAYALSTLYMAIGSWGVIRASVEVLVPKKKQIFVYGAGGLISLIGTIFYGLQTRHNVLLDIASCSTSMGMHDDHHGGVEDDLP